MDLFTQAGFILKAIESGDWRKYKNLDRAARKIHGKNRSASVQDACQDQIERWKTGEDPQPQILYIQFPDDPIHNGSYSLVLYYMIEKALLPGEQSFPKKLVATHNFISDRMALLTCAPEQIEIKAAQQRLGLLKTAATEILLPLKYDGEIYFGLRFDRQNQLGQDALLFVGHFFDMMMAGIDRPDRIVAWVNEETGDVFPVSGWENAEAIRAKGYDSQPLYPPEDVRELCNNMGISRPRGLPGIPDF